MFVSNSASWCSNGNNGLAWGCRHKNAVMILPKGKWSIEETKKLSAAVILTNTKKTDCPITQEKSRKPFLPIVHLSLKCGEKAPRLQVVFVNFLSFVYFLFDGLKLKIINKVHKFGKNRLTPTSNFVKIAWEKSEMTN